MKKPITRLTRRELLTRGAALGGVAMLGGPATLLAAQTASRNAAIASAFDELAKSLRGPLVTPDHVAYDESRRVWNGMIDRQPSAIARCTGVADVVDVINFARKHGHSITVRGGGHNVAGKAVRDGALVLDLARLDDVRVAPANMTARAGGGARWTAFDRETLAFGLASTGGTVSSTGVGGLTLGGGLGWLMRKHGLACDNLISADVVTADGRVLVASDERNSDLFWALRGGGGNFGVVTSFEFRLHELEPVTGGMALYPQARLRELLHFYRDFTAAAPKTVTTMAGALNGPPGTPLEGQSAGWLALCHCGAQEEAERILGQVRGFGEPALGGFGPMSYAAQQTMFDAGAAAGMRNYWRSNFLTELRDEVISLVVSRAEMGIRGPGTLILVEHMGGAIREVADEATAFSNRGAEHNVSVLASWPDAADDEANIAWTRAFGDAIKPYATGAGYVNYMSDDEGAARIRATYASNLKRLREVKRKYDSQNFFSANQNIVP